MKRFFLTLILAEFLLIAGGVLWAQNTVVLLNTQYNAESTGNVLTVPWIRWIRGGQCAEGAAAWMHEWTVPMSGPAVETCQAGTNVKYATLAFADSANLSVQTHYRMPGDQTGTLDATFVWFTTATSGNVVWQMATICVADAETSDPAFNTASTVTDTAKGTTLQLNNATITGVTITGCAAGEMLFLKVSRDAGHASDSLAATAQLVGVELTYRRAL